MSSVWDSVTEGAAAASRRADELAIQGIYASVSVPAPKVRELLRTRGWPFVDPHAPSPDPAQVRQTAERVLARSVDRATALGGLAGMGGMLSVPPEIAAQIVALVRLSQRLAVVYGFDPESERGRLAMQQALSAGLHVDLPEGGPMGLRLSDLPSILARRAPRDVSVAMTRALVRRTTFMVVGRVGRFIPVVSAGFGAVSGRRRVRRVGERMIEVLERLSDLPLDRREGVVDAVEVARS
ncbi:MAG: hypothetical protein EA397_07510 [Deltaproteobacteria bacterium]|nr:MAG: hypothetical protein EA397_07510 [Deltaproteobacteria bacterium]